MDFILSLAHQGARYLVVGCGAAPLSINTRLRCQISSILAIDLENRKPKNLRCLQSKQRLNEQMIQSPMEYRFLVKISGEKKI